MTRNPWPYAIIGNFVLFAAALTAWVAFAVRQDMDLVREDYYEEEIRYQRQIDRVNRTRPIQAQVDILHQPATQSVVLILPPGQAARATGEVHFYRPSDARLDRRSSLTPGRDGRQTFDVGGLAPGLWRIRVTWSVDGRDYFLERPLVMDGN